MSELSPVQEFYRGKTVFITGASGFMGKVLLEKLLYSCSDVKEIIIMMRPKRGKAPETRLEEMWKLPLFHRVRDEKPHVFKKVTLAQGDVCTEALGLTDDTIKHITDNTNIVFHMAATLRLEGNLTDAIEMNTSGTRRTLDLAKKMKNLECFIHLSTAFCNCDQEVMYEKVYEFNHKPEDLMRMAEWMDVEALDKITPELLKPHPNTYTYSKRLAEILVRDQYPHMPVVITRPSIVSPAYKEPLPGWVDNLNGPVGVMIGAAKGVIRSMLCDGRLKSEVIPVDFAINGLIVIPYELSLSTKKSENIPVYNITCIEEKKTTWKYIMDTGRDLCMQYPLNVGLWYPDGNMTMNYYYHWFCVIMFMWLPAYFIDFLLLILGQKRFMVRVQTKIATGLEVLQFFTTRNWDFKSTNYERLYQILSPKDKEIFDMNMIDVDDKEYMKIALLGGKQYVLKEPLDTIPSARIHLKIMYVLDRVCKLFIVGYSSYWLMGKFGVMGS